MIIFGICRLHLISTWSISQELSKQSLQVERKSNKLMRCLASFYLLLKTEFLFFIIYYYYFL